MPVREPVLVALIFGAAAPLASQAPPGAALVAGATPRAARPATVTLAPGAAPAGVGAGRAGGDESGVGVRMVSGALGAAVGLAAGAAAAYRVLPHGECGDDPGLCEAVRGAAIGVVVGAGLGAALPKLGSPCGFGRRAGAGLVGAALGALAGYVVVAGTGAAVITVPLGGVGGGVAGATRC